MTPTPDEVAALLEELPAIRDYYRGSMFKTIESDINRLADALEYLSSIKGKESAAGQESAGLHTLGRGSADERAPAPPAPTVQSELPEEPTMSLNMADWVNYAVARPVSPLPEPGETPETDELAHKQWGTWPKPGEIEAFDLARSLERRLREVERKLLDTEENFRRLNGSYKAAEQRRKSAEGALEGMRERAEAAERRLAEREGMMMAPSKPSWQMKEAGGETWLQTQASWVKGSGLTPMEIAGGIYVAMLAAAPAAGEKEKP